MEQFFKKFNVFHSTRGVTLNKILTRTTFKTSGSLISNLCCRAWNSFLFVMAVIVSPNFKTENWKHWKTLAHHLPLSILSCVVNGCKRIFNARNKLTPETELSSLLLYCSVIITPSCFCRIWKRLTITIYCGVYNSCDPTKLSKSEHKRKKSCNIQ